MKRLFHLGLSLQFSRVEDGALLRRHRAALARHKVARWLRHTLERDVEIAVRIVGTEQARALNRDFRGRDYATNVLTFAYPETPVLSADLVLCAPVIEREASEQRLALEAHYAHLLVHGALHAQGWEHETGEIDAGRMEARESLLLEKLGFADPYR